MRISRREFSKLGALGVGAGLVPRGWGQVAVQDPTPWTGPKVGYCVIGLGRIADHFMRGVQASSTSAITGLVSGHREKAEKIAAQYGVPAASIYSYEDWTGCARTRRLTRCMSRCQIVCMRSSRSGRRRRGSM